MSSNLIGELSSDDFEITNKVTKAVAYSGVRIQKLSSEDLQSPKTAIMELKETIQSVVINRFCMDHSKIRPENWASNLSRALQVIEFFQAQRLKN